MFCIVALVRLARRSVRASSVAAAGAGASARAIASAATQAGRGMVGVGGCVSGEACCGRTSDGAEGERRRAVKKKRRTGGRGGEARSSAGSLAGQGAFFRASTSSNMHLRMLQRAQQGGQWARGRAVQGRKSWRGHARACFCKRCATLHAGAACAPKRLVCASLTGCSAGRGVGGGAASVGERRAPAGAMPARTKAILT